MCRALCTRFPVQRVLSKFSLRDWEITESLYGRTHKGHQEQGSEGIAMHVQSGSLGGRITGEEGLGLGS